MSLHLVVFIFGIHAQINEIILIKFVDYEFCLQINTGIDCGDPATLSNQRVDTPFGTRYPNTATYSCNSGYTLVGSVNRTCGANGNWTLLQPECLVICKTTHLLHSES